MRTTGLPCGMLARSGCRRLKNYALTRQLFARALRRDGWIVRRENFEGARILECCNNALAGSRRIRGTSWFMASSMLISASNSRTCASYLTARLDLLGRHVEAGDRRWH